MPLTTWREAITKEMERVGDSWNNVEAVNCQSLDVSFDSGYGGSEGEPFCLWTKARVYFPAVYDGSEWVESVLRNPDPNYVKSHVGGE